MSKLMSSTNKAHSSELITIQFACLTEPHPSEQQLRDWAWLVLQDRNIYLPMAMRVISNTDMQQLNNQFRQRNYPTNVLAFVDHDEPRSYLGDIALCSAVINNEAQVQHKSLSAHWAHM